MISTITTSAFHPGQLHVGQQVVLGVPVMNRQQLPTHLSAGGGVLEAERRRHPDRYGLDPRAVAHEVVLTVERVDDDGSDLVVVTAGAITFDYEGRAEHHAYPFAVLAAHTVEALALGL